MRSTLTLIAGSAVAIAVSCAIDEDRADDDILRLDTALLVSSRERLEICIQADPRLAISPEQLATRLRDDLGLLQAHHPDWRLAGLDDFDVAIGCPGRPTPTGPLDPKATAGGVVGPGVLARPSPYRVHLHVLGERAAAVVLGERAFARAVAELAVVDDHRVAEVSTALVVRAAMLGTDAFRDDALAQCIGLRVGLRNP